MTGDNSPMTVDAQFLTENRLCLDVTNIVADDAPGGAFISKSELEQIAPLVIEKQRLLEAGQGDCRDGDVAMLGWLRLPAEMTQAHLTEIEMLASEFRQKIDVFVSLGIGGSYLGLEAAFKALSHAHHNKLNPDERAGAPEIYFLGQNLDPDFFRDTLGMLKGKRIGINVISKSGTTLETAVAFRILRHLMERTAGDKASELIVATTDRQKGALRALAKRKGYRTLVVPDDIGGRFSVLSDVGLFGLAVMGIDIRQMLAGARHMMSRLSTEEFWANPAMVYAAIRYLAFQKGKRVEVVASNSTAIYHLARWMEQLFPESEGQKGYGLWLSPALYSEKLHANGQMVQQGPRILIETFLRLGRHDDDVDVMVPTDPDDDEQLNFLAQNGLGMGQLNSLIIDGTAYAHFVGGVPNLTIHIPARNPFNIGQFFYLMEKTVALSGYLAGVNPFIQPGVEAYKKAVFALAGKPSVGAEGQALRQVITSRRQVII